VGDRRGQPKQISAPNAIVLLLLHDGEGSLGLQNGLLGCLHHLRGGVALGRQLTVGTVPYGRPGVLEQPCQWDPVLGRQVQNSSGGSRGRRWAAAKIVRDGKDGKDGWERREDGKDGKDGKGKPTAMRCSCYEQKGPRTTKQSNHESAKNS